LSLTHYNFAQVWEQLRGKKPHLSQFLESLRIRHLRGITDLQVNLGYPVTVIAGPNGCGKTTVLLACACAYDVPGKRDYSPAVLLPNLTVRDEGTLSDAPGQPSFEYFFVDGGSRVGMTWRRSKSWSKSFMGRKGGRQPRRALYLRTLANLTSPSEVRSILQIGKQSFTRTDLDADLIALAHRVLPFKYRGMKLLTVKGRDLLFADREEAGTAYSEFHMSAGERALLRISKDISRLRDALILIDEVEAGLHPYTQQQLMLELQRLALRNDLQIIVTSHSAVVLESVPPEGRVFLERTLDNVLVRPAYRNVFQRAFYGRPQDRLSVLCEDALAQALILGVLDRINPLLQLTPDDITVGRDTGKDQFAQHVEALGKFKLLDEFLFVLDGDARDAEAGVTAAAGKYNRVVKPLFLPGDAPPEEWLYAVLEANPGQYEQELGAPGLGVLLQQLRQQFDNAADRPVKIAKARFATLADSLQRTPEDIARRIGRIASEAGPLKVFAEELMQAVADWRSRTSA
jgi:predicted ATPase